MSPEEDQAGAIAAMAVQLAPCFLAGLDFSSRGPAWGNPGEPSDYEKLVERCFTAAQGFANKRDALLKDARIASGIRRAKEAKDSHALTEEQRVALAGLGVVTPSKETEAANA